MVSVGSVRSSEKSAGSSHDRTEPESASQGAFDSDFITGLYDEISGCLKLFLMRKSFPADEAEDMVQDVFVRLCELEAAHKIEYVKSFAFKMAQNLAIDSIRKKKVRRGNGASSDILADIPDDDERPDDWLEQSQKRQLMLLALDALPKRCSQVVRMHKLEEKSHAEVASELGITRHAVEKHMVRAMARCRQFLQDKHAVS